LEHVQFDDDSRAMKSTVGPYDPRYVEALRVFIDEVATLEPLTPLH